MAKTGDVLLGLAAGLAVGVAVGILFTPDKGEETRKKIKDGASDKADRLKRKLERLTQEVREKSGEVKENLEEKVENLLSRPSYKTDDVTTFLEKKLAALKEANAKLRKQAIMSFHSIKESFKEVPTKVTDALDAQVAYYKLFLFRFIAQSSTDLITLFIVAFACLLMLFFMSIVVAYAVGEAVGSIAWGFVIVGILYITVAVGAFFFRGVLAAKPLLKRLLEIYFKVVPDNDEE